MVVVDASIYYTRLKTHFRFIKLHCITHFTIKNFFIGILYGIVIFLVALFSSFCRLFDELLFPNYKNIVVKQPVFIISNPRSGTTYLHRLMCLDHEKFVYTLLYHTTFPSITIFKMIDFFGLIDRRIGRPMRKFFDWIDNTFFGDWDDIHATGFNRSEEDEGLHFISGISASVGLITPYEAAFKELYIPDKLSEKEKENIKKYYLSTIQKWMYALGSDKLFLCKSVMSTGRLQMLHELFPDIKIIYLVRNPLNVLPSFTSMFASTWSVLYKQIPKNSPEYREWGNLGIEYYKYFTEQKTHFKEENFITVLYDDLVKHPKDTVTKIYQQLQLEMTDGFIERLTEVTSKTRDYKSKHDYSLVEYGYDEATIKQELNFLYQEYPSLDTTN